jgi:hypothetical protein
LGEGQLLVPGHVRGLARQDMPRQVDARRGAGIEHEVAVDLVERQRSRIGAA